MTSHTLGEAYIQKARARLRVLDVLKDAGAYSDVVREAQEVVELALKGVLRLIGVDPPKFHDVGPILAEFKDRLPDGLRPHVERLAAISKWLRKEREFSFYGDVDFIPTEQYTEGDASRAIADARFVVETVDASRKALPGSSHPGAQTPPDAGDAQQP